MSGDGERSKLLSHNHGAWRSPVARLLWEQEVPGSNPGAPMAQAETPPASVAGGVFVFSRTMHIQAEPPIYLDTGSRPAVDGFRTV